MSWFAVGLAEIRTRLISREKEDCKQFKLAQSPRVTQVGDDPSTRYNFFPY